MRSKSAKLIPGKNKIEGVVVRRILDECPDTSYLGEYSNSPKSDYSIDRAHSVDCAINTGGLVWFSSSSGRIELQMTEEQAESASHSGQCDEDVKSLSEVPEIKAQLDRLDASLLAKELKEYGAWDETELADHGQNLQRILWLAAGDISENSGCDCGERGDMNPRELRYFNPPYENYKGCPDAEIRKYCLQDYARMESANRGDWCYIGIKAEAEISIPSASAPHISTLQTIHSGGLWGIESDSDKAHFAETEANELAELREQLYALGFSKRAIAAAFKPENIKHKDN